MKNTLTALVMLYCLLFAKAAISQDNDDLANYIKRLRDDYAGPRKETGFMSAGSAFLYAQDYFEAKNYPAAADRFAEVLEKEKDNPYANYQLAVSLLKQNNENKKQKALEYLENAFRLNPSLRERYKRDVTGNGIPPDNNLPADNKTVQNKEQLKTNTGGLQNYINRLKKSRSEGGEETAMNTAGQRALYGIEYYEANEFMSAETDFKLALARDPENPYINYLLAVSMAAQGKEEAKVHLQKAIKGDPSVAGNYNKDVANATAKWKALVEKRKIKTAPVTPVTYGGGLIFSNYTCHQSIWNGPNTSPAYSFQYKGYIILKGDGTYSWHGNSESGRYKYDPKTGNVTWLSGYFKTVEVKLTQYQLNKETAQMTINFSDSYRWECGCKKK